MGNAVGKFAVFLISVFILFYVGYQVYRNIFPGFTTQTVMSYTVDDTIEAQALAVRNVTNVKANKTGVVNYIVKNGEKVGKQGAVAEIYDNASQSQTQLRIREIDEKIERLEGLQADGAVSLHHDLLIKQIDGKILELTKMIASKKLSELGTVKNDLTEYINRYQIVTGRVDNFNDTIKALKQEKEEISKLLGKKPTIVRSPVSGYFISADAACQSPVSVGQLSTLTASQLNQAIEGGRKPVGDDVIGVVIEDFEWYLACHLKQQDALRLTQGSTLYILLPNVMADELPVVVHSINKEADGSAVVVFCCKNMSQALSTIFVEPIKIRVKRISGLYVDARAIHFNQENVMGVYVLFGSEIRFTPIVPVYTEKKFVICSTTDEKSKLKLYDEVVVGGRNLYDKKVIK